MGIFNSNSLRVISGTDGLEFVIIEYQGKPYRMLASDFTAALGLSSGGGGVDEAAVRASLGTLTGATDLGSFLGTTISNSVTVKAALQQLETALEAITADISGQFLGSATTFAALPTPAEASNGDWAALTADDGVNLSGIYGYDGAAFSFIMEIADAFTLDATGFDGNLAVTDNTLQEVAQKFDDYIPGKDRVFASSTDVTVVNTGAPTVAEIKVWNDGLGTPNSDTIIYYTGTITSTDPINYVFHVDKSANVTLIKSDGSIYSQNGTISEDRTVTTTDFEVKYSGTNSDVIIKDGEVYGSQFTSKDTPLEVSDATPVVIEPAEADNYFVYTNTGGGYDVNIELGTLANFGNVIQVAIVNSSGTTRDFVFEAGNFVDEAGDDVGTVTLADNEYKYYSFAIQSLELKQIGGAPSGGGEVLDWEATTDYKVGQLVLTPTNAVARRSTVGTSGATFDALEAVKWNYVSQLDSLPNFVASAIYLEGQEIVYNTQIFTSYTTREAGLLFDRDERANWGIIKDIDRTKLSDELFDVDMSPVVGDGGIYRNANILGVGYNYGMSDIDGAVTTQYNFLPNNLVFENGNVHTIRYEVLQTVLTNQVIRVGLKDLSGNETYQLINIGQNYGVVVGGTDVGVVTSSVSVKQFNTSLNKKLQIDFTTTWTGTSTVPVFIVIEPAYNNDGTAVADASALGSVDILDITMGASTEFIVSGGLAQQGIVPTNITEQGIYDAEGTNASGTLDAAILGQSRVNVITQNLAGVGTQIFPPTGTAFYGYGVDAPYTTQSIGEKVEFYSDNLGVWNVQINGLGDNVSSRVGEMFFAKSGSTVQGHLAVTPGTVVGAADSNPVWASMYPEFVSGSDIVFPADVEGMFLRNLGGNAGAEGIFQADRTARPTNNFTTNTTGNHAHTIKGNNSSTGEGETSVSSGGTDKNFTGQAAGNHSHTITGGGDIETNPINRAYQLYTILDNYNEVVMTGMVAPTPLHYGRLSKTDGVSQDSNAELTFNEATYSNGTTLSTASNSITINQNGRYKIEMMVGFGDINVDYDVEFRKNGITIETFSVDSAGSTDGPTSFSYDADLVATDIITIQLVSGGDLVTFVGLGTTAYLDVRQLPDSTVVISESDMEVDDQAASGYMDIGTMRMQWGTTALEAGAYSLVFPVAFGAIPTVTYTIEDSSARETGVDDITTTGVTLRYAGTGSRKRHWYAIGLKP